MPQLGHRTVSEIYCQLAFLCGATHTALILLQPVHTGFQERQYLKEQLLDLSAAQLEIQCQADGVTQDEKNLAMDKEGVTAKHGLMEAVRKHTHNPAKLLRMRALDDR